MNRAAMHLGRAGNVEVTAKAVDAKAVELRAVPKKQDGVKPIQFFFRATAK